MTKVVVYSKENCPYCVRAKQLLNQLAVQFTEIMVDRDEEQLATMMQLSGKRTVPQIFINDQSIGGCDDLYAIYNAGKLQDLVA